MITKIINELYDKNIVKDILINMSVIEDDIDDLAQEIFLILLEYDRDKIIDMYNKGQLKFFIVGVVQRQYHSKTSPYYKKYKKYYTIVDNNREDNEINDD